MPVKGNKPEEDKNQKPAFFKKCHILLLCVLVIFSAALCATCSHFYTTASATASAIAENAKPVDDGQEPKSMAAAGTADPLAAMPSIWPARGEVTSGFGWRISPFGGGNEQHPGIDIAYMTGAPVVATADGRVVQSGWAGGYGNMVQIDHGKGISTIYGHNSKLAVNVGQTVKKGQIISYAGSTGKSTGPHVHYEVRVNGTAVDPWKYLVLY